MMPEIIVQLMFYPLLLLKEIRAKKVIVLALSCTLFLMGFSAGHRCASDGREDLRDQLARSSYKQTSFHAPASTVVDSPTLPLMTAPGSEHGTSFRIPGHSRARHLGPLKTTLRQGCGIILEDAR